jgi:hypothetical protein
VGGEHLIVVVRVEIAFAAVERDRLLEAHHDRVGKAAHEHHQAQDHVHDPDLLVIDAGEPFLPEIAPETEIGERTDQRDPAKDHADKGGRHDRFVEEGKLLQGEASQKRGPLRWGSGWKGDSGHRGIHRSEKRGRIKSGTACGSATCLKRQAATGGQPG